MYCKNCNSPVTAEQKFCTVCGADLSAQQAQAPQQEPAQPQQPQQPMPEQPYAQAPQQPYAQAQQPYAPTPQQPYAQAPQQPYAPTPQQPYAPMPQQPYAPMPQQPYAQAPQQPYVQAPQQPYAPTPQQPYAPMPQQPYAPAPEAAPKKKGKAKFFVLGAVAAVLAVAVLLTALNWRPIINQFKKMTLSDKEYLSYVHELSQQDLLDGTLGAWDAVYSSVDLDNFSLESTLTLELGEAAKDLLPLILPSSVANMQLPPVSLQGSVSNTGKAQGGDLSLSVNQSALLSAQFAVNEKGELLLYLPELNETPLKVPNALATGSAFDESTGGIVPSYSGASSAFLNTQLLDVISDPALISTLLHRYSALLLAELKNVSVKQDSLTVGDTTEKCSVYTAVFDEDSYKKASVAILKSLKTDKEIDQALKDLCAIESLGVTYAQVRGEYLEALEEALEVMEDYSPSGSQEVIAYTAYVNDGGEMIGLSLRFPDGNSLHLLSPKNNGNFETLFLLEDDDHNQILLQGKGTQKGDLITGDYSISTTETGDILDWHLENWNGASAKKGMLNGSVTVKPGSSLMRMTASGQSAAAFLQSMALELNFSSPSVTESTVKASVTYNSRPLVTVTASAKTGAPKTIPTIDRYVSVTDQQALSDWTTTTMENLKKVQSNAIAAGVPSEIFELLTAGGTDKNNSSTENDSWYDEEADSWYDEEADSWYGESDSWYDEEEDSWYDEEEDSWYDEEEDSWYGEEEEDSWYDEEDRYEAGRLEAVSPDATVTDDIYQIILPGENGEGNSSYEGTVVGGDRLTATLVETPDGFVIEYR